MLRIIGGILVLLLVLAATSGPNAFGAEKRVALVFGNSAYLHATELANPRNDAEDIAAALEKLGFKVVKGLDLDKSGMDRAIRSFAEAARGAGIALFFYAGHGLQVNGRNYLVPIDAQLKTVEALDFEMVGLDVVQRTMEAVSETNVLFVDACRDNPLSRNLARAMGTRSTGIGNGLVAQEAGAGTLISFSTQPGNVALDGTGSRNSPYAVALAKHISTQDKDLSGMLLLVRRDVMTATARRQVPWEHSALTAEIRLAPAEPAPKSASAPPPEAVAPATNNAGEASPGSGNATELNPPKAQAAAPVAKPHEPRKTVVNVKRNTGILSLTNARNTQVVYDESCTLQIKNGMVWKNASIDLPAGFYCLRDHHGEYITIEKFEIKPGERVEFDKFAGSLSLNNAKGSQVVYDEAGLTRITKTYVSTNNSIDLPSGIYSLRDSFRGHITISKFEIKAGENVDFSNFVGSLSLKNAQGMQILYDQTGKTKITSGNVSDGSIDLPPGLYSLKDYDQGNVTIDSFEIRAGEETLLDFGG